jgi:STAS domain
MPRRRVRALVAEAAPPVRWVVVAAEPITDVDTTASDTLGQLLQELRQQQVTLAFAELKDPVKDRLKRYGLFGAIGPDRFFPTIGTAVDGYVQATGTTWGRLGGAPRHRFPTRRSEAPALTVQVQQPAQPLVLRSKLLQLSQRRRHGPPGSSAITRALDDRVSDQDVQGHPGSLRRDVTVGRG